MAEENYIPRRLQERKFLFWHHNELLIFFATLGSGLLIGKELFGILLGIFLVKLLKTINRNGREGYLLSLIYWYFPSCVSGFKNTPPSYKRRFIG